MTEYNYREFVMEQEMLPFDRFSSVQNAGGKALSFTLEELDSGSEIEMKRLWAKGFAVIEFGSFT